MTGAAPSAVVIDNVSNTFIEPAVTIVTTGALISLTVFITVRKVSKMIVIVIFSRLDVRQ